MNDELIKNKMYLEDKNWENAETVISYMFRRPIIFDKVSDIELYLLDTTVEENKYKDVIKIFYNDFKSALDDKSHPIKYIYVDFDDEYIENKYIHHHLKALCIHGDAWFVKDGKVWGWMQGI